MEWSDTKNVAWKISVPGLGWSSPAIADGKVFLTTAVPQGQGLSLRVLAVDAVNGKTIWDRELRVVEKAPAIHTKNSHASPTPIIRDGAVFVNFGALGMARLSASPVLANGHVLFFNETGETTWVQASKEFIILGKNTVPGRTFATPAFSDAAMYLRTDETLYRFAE